MKKILFLLACTTCFNNPLATKLQDLSDKKLQDLIDKKLIEIQTSAQPQLISLPQKDYAVVNSPTRVAAARDFYGSQERMSARRLNQDSSPRSNRSSISTEDLSVGFLKKTGSNDAASIASTDSNISKKASFTQKQLTDQMKSVREKALNGDVSAQAELKKLARAQANIRSKNNTPSPKKVAKGS